MSRQLSDHARDLVYKCSDEECMNEKSENLLFNSYEAMSFSDDSVNSENCSMSLISYSDNDENQSLTCKVLEEMQSTRQKLTFDWVKTMASNVSRLEFDSSFDCSGDNIRTDSETDDSSGIDQNNSIEASPENNDIIFKEDLKDGDLSELKFFFAEAVTEENYDSGFSFSTKGSLANCIDYDFLEDDDYELVFSTPSLSTGYTDIISEASELSQGFDNEIFVDFFEKPAKSKALKRVNERWQNDMFDVDEKPRDPVKVTFAPIPNLVTVHSFQRSLEENLPYDTYALDRLRFKNRIEELNQLLSPILTLEHRTKILLRNSLQITCD